MARRNTSGGCIGAILIMMGILTIVCIIIYLGLAVAIVCTVGCIIYGTIKLVNKKRNKPEEIVDVEEEPNIQNINRIDMYNNKIDYMTGEDFELYIAQLLGNIGFYNIQTTKGSGDQGVDILAEKEGMKYAFQCKRYDKPVGNKAVQEVFAGKFYYHCHVAVVVTNNYFTQSAKDLAHENGVLLWDREIIESIASSSFDNIIEGYEFQEVKVSDDEIIGVAQALIDSFIKCNVYLKAKECYAGKNFVRYTFESDKGTRIKDVLSCKEDVSFFMGTKIDINVNYEKGILEIEIQNEFIERYKGGKTEEMAHHDEYFEKVGKYVIYTKSASIGKMMREFCIGFERASKILEELKRENVIGDKDNDENEILMTMEEFESYLSKTKNNA